MKRLLLLSVCFMMGMSAIADDTQKASQVVTIDGTTVEKVVTKITFDGDKALLHFEGESTPQEVDMDLVKIVFSYSPTGISIISTDQEGYYKVFDLNGRFLGTHHSLITTHLKSGIYVINGKKFIIK